VPCSLCLPKTVTTGCVQRSTTAECTVSPADGTLLSTLIA
jgi:hypothetical protein